MHQHPRAPPPTASPAKSERTNPEKTNNHRDRDSGLDTPPAETLARPPQQSADQGHKSGGNSTNSTTELARLNQVIQNFHTKAALIILHTRVNLAPAYAKGSRTKRLNKWFNVELDETDDYRDDIRPWKTCDYKEHRPPPLVIEVFLSTGQLTSKQSLVILDDQGKKWEVPTSPGAHGPRRWSQRSLNGQDVILERWTIQLGEDGHHVPADLSVVLPLVYKKAIVLFRSLFTYSAFLPAWKLSKKLSKAASRSNLELGYRIMPPSASSRSAALDGLTTPLYPSQDEVTSDYLFGSTESPAGSFSVQVTYRSNCGFGVDDAESLLSSRFIGADDEWFRPSVPAEGPTANAKAAAANEVGSLPNARTNVVPRPDLGQAYGSLSTFHQIGAATGTSPITALRNAQELGSASPTSSPPTRTTPIPRSSDQTARSSVRGSGDGNLAAARRTSISLQPFKTPSLSASPSLLPTVFGSSNQSVGRSPALPVVAESQAMPPPAAPSSASRKTPSTSSDQQSNTDASSVPAPAPGQKYTSSFSHRRSRLSSGSVARTEDDQASSGKASPASSGNPVSSGLMAYGGAVGNTATVQEDDEKISEFIKLLESKKDLLTPADSAAAETSTRRTAAALHRFHRMRESNAALSESMSASLRRSSSSSSRQLSSLPPMIAATSLSTSSSPSKPVSPHTPHTPAIPSRLSSQSVVPQSRRGYQGAPPLVEDHGELSEEASSEVTAGPAASHVPPIDIPTSPRMMVASFRRSSSAAQRRVVPDEDEIGDLYGLRAASMGAYTRTELGTPTPPVETPADERRDHDGEMADGVGAANAPAATFSFGHQTGRGSGARAKPAEGLESGSGSGSSSLQQTHRSRLSRGGGGVGRGATPLQGSESGGSSSLERRGGLSRQSFSRAAEQKQAVDEDEPLFLPFAMSDLGASRRSLEEARTGPGSSTSDKDRPSGESRRWPAKKPGPPGWPP